MKKYSQGGFTLIELLVVIAIIGILSSVVLASLSTARNKGADAKIQSQLQSMRAQAELFSGTHIAITAVSGTPCATTGVFQSANNGLGNLLGGITTQTRCASDASGNWALSAVTSTGAWCVDSTGVSRGATSGGTPYTTTLTSSIAANTVVCL